MSRFLRPDPRADDPAASGPPSAEEAPSSEFMSEDSPEVRAMWAPQTKVVSTTFGKPPAVPTGEAPPSQAASARVPAATATDPVLPDNSSRASLLRRLATVAPPAAPMAGAAVSAPDAVRPESSSPSRPQVTWAVIGAITVIALLIGTSAVWRDRARQPSGNAPAPAAVSEGSATIVSRPAGADVLLNGVSRGVTPLKLTLPVGSYELELRNGASKRSLTLTVDAATAVREFVDLAPDGGRGSVNISTDIAGARVTIDGASRGVTPLTVTDLEPGSHRIGVSNNGTTVFRTVTVTAGTTTAVVASVAPAAPIAPAGATGGWVSIESPLELQVLEGAEVVGTTSAKRLMLPAGRHDLLLSAPSYDFRTSIAVQIAAGRTVTVPVRVPNGTLSINAAPWADVSIDGKPVGTTPIGNISVTVGPHDVLWRHPQLGERRQVVAVGASTPARASVDLTKAP